ncbi:type VI secretion system tube protein TssD [Vibrio mangrovi]|uniref:Pyocin-S2 n=1 Tax=Vibrio mangrovi TaxID=474394 RepID=A0A1Y6INM4_9VIBR|nr:type VI secretion system tube protein TssD [Vibrio mangrovi]MDW6003967.1 type VI secretion system tube protein TssD [Vibrio mangrovi]SMR99238.1 Pyocin-S2 [Vibrio mangrovi]
MAHTAYITLRGAKQGLISGGCNTKDSMANRYQENHTDQITVLACDFSMYKDPHQHSLSHDAIRITKSIDKSSPLLAMAFARQEYLEGTIDFYRTNEKGYNEKFYSVALQKAVISGISSESPHSILSSGKEMSETISLRYQGIQQEHLICGTMAFDGWENDNTLAVMQGYQDIVARKPLPTTPPEQPVINREATQTPEKVFAKSPLVPSGTCNIGIQRETLSSVGQYAAYTAVLNNGIAEAGLSRVAGQALAEIEGMAVRLVGLAPAAAAVTLGMLVPSPLADGTLYDESEIRQKNTVKTNIRLGIDDNGQVYGYHVDGDKVPKREVVQYGDKFTVDLEPGISIEWIPISGDFGGKPILVNPIPDVEKSDIWIHPQAEQGKAFEKTYITPIQDAGLKDYILTFPADTGLPPLYVVYKESPRNEAGVVTGTGEDITGQWLEAAGKELGSPVPSQIADKLRGREFSSFDEFREAFWLTVSEDKSLMSQFSRSNQTLIRMGNAPYSVPEDQAGGRKTYEIHHVEEIQHGGAVYDVDNMRVNTPKNHINIHRNK